MDNWSEKNVKKKQRDDRLKQVDMGPGYIQDLIAELNSDEAMKMEFLHCLGLRVNVDVMPYDEDTVRMLSDIELERR